MHTTMQVKAGTGTGSMRLGAQRQALRGSPLISNNRAMRISGVRTHSMNIRAEKVRFVDE